MKANENWSPPQPADSDYDQRLQQALQPFLRGVAVKLNQLAGGAYSAKDGGMINAPTTGTYLQGDFVVNSAPVEAGSITAKYVVEGWMCVASGTPGTWVQKRFLTGN